MAFSTADRKDVRFVDWRDKASSQYLTRFRSRMSRVLLLLSEPLNGGVVRHA